MKYDRQTVDIITVADLIASTKLVTMELTNPGGGTTAERIYMTAWLCVCNSELSLSSDIQMKSGLEGMSDDAGKVLN